MIIAKALIEKLQALPEDALVLMSYVVPEDTAPGWTNIDVMDVMLVGEEIHIVGVGDGTEG